jgi:hypothetical protein
VTARRAVPSWFTATSIELFLDGPLGGLTTEVELAGLVSELTTEVSAVSLLAPHPAG